MAKGASEEAERRELAEALTAPMRAPRTRRQMMPFAIPVVDADLSSFDKGCILTVARPGHDDLEVGETVALKDPTNELCASAKVLELVPDPRFELLEQPLRWGRAAEDRSP